MISRLKSRVFYGWFMVAAGFVAQLMTGALLNQSYGAYVVLLAQELNWNKTSLSAAFSLARFESGMLGPLDGWLIDRFGPRAVMRVGLIIYGVGFMLFSQVDSLFTFYLAFAIMALGSSMGGFMPLTVALVNWFHRRRATALATMQTGFAVGGLLVPVVVLALQTFGWRTTAFASGVIILVIGLPLTQVIRGRPEDYGPQIDGGPDSRGSSARMGRFGRPAPSIDFRAGEALRTRAFWLISLGHGSGLLVVTAVQVHLVAHLHEHLGFSLAGAGLIVSLMTMVQISGQLLGGFLGDRISKRAIAAACMGGHMVGLLMLGYADSLPMVIAFAVIHGLSWGMRGPLMQAIRADYFGRASFGLIIGFSSLITTFGNTSGPLVAGILADRTGAYQTGFTVLALMAGAGSIFFILAARPHPPARLRDPETTVAALTQASAAI